MNAMYAPSASMMQFCDSTCPSDSSVPTPWGVAGRAYELQCTTPLEGVEVSHRKVRIFTGRPSE